MDSTLYREDTWAENLAEYAEVQQFDDNSEFAKLPVYMNDALPHLQEGKKLVFVLTGLPARGKTYAARKVCRYLHWLGFQTRVFSVGQYRRDRIGAKVAPEFFSDFNPEGMRSRMLCYEDALSDMVRWLLSEGGEVAFFDATNSTKSRRVMIEKRISLFPSMQLVWMEFIVDDETLIDAHIRQTKISSADYVGVDTETAVSDFKRRIETYEATYEPFDTADNDRSYVRIINFGRQIVLNKIHGYLPSRIVSFLMNLHTHPRPIYMSRHGESEYNVDDKIGGDPPLSSQGMQYASELADYFDKIPELKHAKQISVWTSTMRRARMTAGALRFGVPLVYWKALDEINVGVCDGYTYDQVKCKMPLEAALRAQDKLRYRYPRGESYMDLINRLEPVIFELERTRHPVVIIGHQGVLRCLYGYFTDKNLVEIPHQDVSLHTIIKLTPKTYDCDEERIAIGVPQTRMTSASNGGDTPLSQR